MISEKIIYVPKISIKATTLTLGQSTFKIVGTLPIFESIEECKKFVSEYTKENHMDGEEIVIDTQKLYIFNS